MAEQPRLPEHGEIGDETGSPAKWAAPHWPEIKIWFAVGCCTGGGLVTGLVATLKAETVTSVGSTLGWISLILIAIGFVLVYFGQHARRLRVEEYERKLEAWNRQVREHVRDELSDSVERARQSTNLELARKEIESKEWQIERERLRSDVVESRAAVAAANGERDKLRTELDRATAARIAAENQLAEIKRQIAELQRNEVTKKLDSLSRYLTSIGKL